MATDIQHAQLINSLSNLSDDHAIFSTIIECVTSLGQIGPDERELTYGLLATYIISKDFPKSIILNLCFTLTSDKFLFHRLESTDFTLLRSFSALIVGCIISTDNYHMHHQLNSQELNQLCNLFLTYLKSEKDIRGYDSTHGWIHACAHTFDSLDLLINHEKIDQKTASVLFLELIEFIKNRGRNVLAHTEDYRISKVLTSCILLEKSDIIFNYMHTFTLEDTIYKDYSQNLISIFRCIYLNLLWKDKAHKLLATIEPLLKD